MTTYGFVHLEYGSQHRQQSIAMLARLRRQLAREAMHNDRPGTHTYKWYKATPLTAETFDELRMKARCCLSENMLSYGARHLGADIRSVSYSGASGLQMIRVRRSRRQGCSLISVHRRSRVYQARSNGKIHLRGRSQAQRRPVSGGGAAHRLQSSALTRLV